MNKRGKKALILDLDDTIFQTRSMDPIYFKPFFNELRKNLSSGFEPHTISKIIEELWNNTWDKVMARYNISHEAISNSIKMLDHLEKDLNIAVFEDYRFLKALNIPKFLVTTSLTSLQKTKISSLKIENDFEKIVINDTFIESKSKLEIFGELVDEYELNPSFTYVIGDNSESEIKAGNELNMVTIQILRPGVVKGNNAMHYISGFEELPAILEARGLDR